MFIDRRINAATNTVELWRCDWEYPEGGAARKVHIAKVCDEQPISAADQNLVSEKQAICWAYGRTLGNIAVFSPAILGQFPGKAGEDALLPCDFVEAGKFRHGKQRWWCRTHQTHWGTKADFQSLDDSGSMTCANRDQRMNYVVSPRHIDTSAHAEIGIWCSLPPALSSRPIQQRRPKIHVHVRDVQDGPKTVDSDFHAIALVYNEDLGLFDNPDITRVNVTPPAALDFVCGLEEGREMSCVNCSRCGYPHLDLGDFALTPHRKHFCGNCGSDSTWSVGPIVSTPLKPLHDQLLRNRTAVHPDRTLNMDEFTGCNYNVWASTPAIVWTAARPQEVGIHVHIHDGTKRVIDDTFSTVVHNGQALDRGALFRKMVERIVATDEVPTAQPQ